MFCENTGMILTPITNSDKLVFKSVKTGNIVEAKPDDTLLLSKTFNSTDDTDKYKNILNNTAFDTTNPRIRTPYGCSKCKRKVVSYQRVGEIKKVYYVCICGHIWY